MAAAKTRRQSKTFHAVAFDGNYRAAQMLLSATDHGLDRQFKTQKEASSALSAWLRSHPPVAESKDQTRPRAYIELRQLRYGPSIVERWDAVRSSGPPFYAWEKRA